ncbi:MAG: flagellar FliJ family protein [Gammaproteobacteria bacterium]|nr:flagellar FliJ family protein [Gammaproteobacteria bacterium]
MSSHHNASAGASGRALKVVLEAAQVDETEAARQLASLVDAETAAVRQLEQLLQFLDEYVAAGDRATLPAGHSTGSNPALNPALLGNRYLFVDRLMDALKVQHRRRASIGEEVARQRARWVELQARRRAVEKLIERHRDREREQSERREQALLDAVANSGPARLHDHAGHAGRTALLPAGKR